MVALVQEVFWEVTISEACDCQTVVLIPKGGGKEFRVIGLVEVLFKSATGIINWRLTAEIR